MLSDPGDKENICGFLTFLFLYLNNVMNITVCVAFSMTSMTVEEARGLNRGGRIRHSLEGRASQAMWITYETIRMCLSYFFLFHQFHIWFGVAIKN